MRSLRLQLKLPPLQSPPVCGWRHCGNTRSPELTCFLLPSPPECLTGTVGTLLLENPLGQNGLSHQGLVYEAAKVFGLRSRRLKLFLNETQTQGEAAVPKAFPSSKGDLGASNVHVLSVKISFVYLSCFVYFCALTRN